MRDVLLQIAQVITALALAPLLQGVILQWQERVQRAQGPGYFPALPRSLEAIPQATGRPAHGEFHLLDCAGRRVHRMLTVPILIPVLTNFPLPQSDMGDILGGGLILTLGSFLITLAGLDSGSAYGGIGSSPSGHARHPGRADADSRFRRHHIARQSDAAVRRQPSAGGNSRLFTGARRTCSWWRLFSSCCSSRPTVCRSIRARTSRST